MKIYIASRTAKKEMVKKFHELLKNKGIEIIVDWTIHKYIKPYDQNKDIATHYAIEDINGAKNCDIFILLSDEAGTGMYVELGAALASNLSTGKPKIYLVGNHMSTVFHFHPAVNRRETIEEVLQEM